MVTCRYIFRHSLRRPGPTIAKKGHHCPEKQSLCTNFVLALRAATVKFGHLPGSAHERHFAP
jgi:hypothetical protein